MARQGEARNYKYGFDMKELASQYWAIVMGKGCSSRFWPAKTLHCPKAKRLFYAVSVSRKAGHMQDRSIRIAQPRGSIESDNPKKCCLHSHELSNARLTVIRLLKFLRRCGHHL